jgi:signal transduction histidine kinase
LAIASIPPTAPDPLGLRPRLLARGGGFALLLLLTFAGAMYWGIAADREEDLHHRVEQLAAAASGQLPLLVHEFHEESNANKFRGDGVVVEVAGSRHQRVRWFDGQGRLVRQQGDLRLPAPPPPELRQRLQWRRWPGGLRLWQPVRTRSLTAGGPLRHSGYVEVGISDHELESELARMRRGLLLGTICAALVALALGRRLLKSALAPLQAQVAALQRFMADASHELRHPLTMVRTLVATTLPESESGEVLARIDAVAARMGRLLDDLLLLARHEQGVGEGRVLRRRWRRFDLLDLLDDLRSLHAAAAAERQLQLVLEAPSLQAVPVEGQPDHLERLFTNLLSNALRHSPAGGVVRLAVNLQGTWVKVEVVDQGSGIPAGLQEKVFERFWQGGGVSREGSAGLGLAIARAIARAHGGELRVADGRPGRCSLEVRLPLEGEKRSG